LKNLLEDILTKLDFSFLESQVSEIDFKFKILICDGCMLIMAGENFFDEFVIFSLCKNNKSINSVIVKNFDLMLIMFNKEIE